MKKFESLKLEPTVACIVEGNAEEAIMNILLDHDCLIFDRKQLLEEDLLRCRKAKNFCSTYLNKTFHNKITVLRILDDRRETFKLPTAYKNKVSGIHNIITAPEIEILAIIKEKALNDFKRVQHANHLKPSEYCKQNLRLSELKTYDFVYGYFQVEELIDAINEYARVNDPTQTALQFGWGLK